jgi:hypothetical protein
MSPSIPLGCTSAQGKPPSSRGGGFRREPSCIGISRRTADAHSGTNGASDQDATTTTGDHRSSRFLRWRTCRRGRGAQGHSPPKAGVAFATGGQLNDARAAGRNGPHQDRRWFPPIYETSGGSRLRAPLSPSSPAQSSARAARRRRPGALPARSTIVAPGARQDPVRERSSLPGR